MTFGKNSLFGSAIGAALLCGACGTTPYVAGSGLGTSSATSPLRLDLANIVNPAAPVANALYVKSSSLLGFYHGCLGQVSGTEWEMLLGQGNSSVKVAQLDQTCQLRATGIRRVIWTKTAGSEITENYYFHTITTNSLGSMHVDALADQAMLYDPAHPTLRLANVADVEIRDGFATKNLRMAVRANGTAMALVNIAGVETGAQGTGAGGFANDFQVNVLTGSTASELFNNLSSSQINYSVNLQASSKELPAPTYVMDASTVRVAVDPTGAITPASAGAFKLVVGTKQFVAQAGSEYILPQPTDGDTCATSLAQIVGCGTVGSIVDPTRLPSDSAYTALNESEQYSVLFARWQLLKDLGRPAKSITTSDKSISVPILTFFPPGTRLFSLKADQSGYDSVNNTQIVLVRNRASGGAGSDFDVASGVQSFQAFQVTILPPSIL